MVNFPLFSIVIPSYNRCHVITRAIESVLNQSLSNFELIVIDDGSVDNTNGTVLSISDPRIIYKYQSNKGVCAARNKGASISKGKYLIFLDSDDELYPNALQAIYDSSAKNGFPDLIFSDLEKKDLGGSVSRISARNPFGKGEEVGVYLTGAYAIKNDFFHQLGGFDEHIRFGENAELKIRIEKQKFTYSITDSISVIYYLNAEGGSSNLANRIEANEYIIQKHPEFFRNNKKVLKLYLQSNAVSQVRIRKLKGARYSIRRAFVTTPFDLFLFIRLIIMHIPFLPKIVWK